MPGDSPSVRRPTSLVKVWTRLWRSAFTRVAKLLKKYKEYGQWVAGLTEELVFVIEDKLQIPTPV